MKTLYGCTNDLHKCGPCSITVNGVRKNLPDYEMWKGIISRAFSDKEKLRRPS